MKLGTLLSAFACMTLSMGFATPAKAEDPIKIGVYMPLTGQNAFAGQLELEGIQLAHKITPTVLGRPVELVVVDNKSDKVEAANAVKRLTEHEKVLAIIGTYGSSLAMAGGEVAERAKVPVLATSSTNPLVTQGKKYYFRACFIDPYQGAAAATYAYKNLGYKKAAVLTDVANDYAVGLSNFFKKTFKKIGGELVADMKYSSGDQDFTAQLTELISKKPDIVFMPAYFAEGAIIMKQARELGATFVLMGADAMDNPDTLKIGGKAVEGFLHTTFPYDVNMENMSAEAKTFTDAWKKNFPNKDPNVNATLGYTCYDMTTADYRGILFNFNNPYWTENRDIIPAVCYAIDRQAIVDSVLLGQGMAAYSPLQRNVYNDETVNHYDYDPAKAKEILESVGCTMGESGYYERNGEEIGFVISVMSGEQDRIDIAQAAAQQLREVGIHCTVDIPAQMDWSGQMACLIGWGSPFDADDHTYKVFGTDKGANYSGYSNALVDEYLTLARQSSDDAVRKEYYGKFLHALADDPAYAFICYIDANYVAKSTVHGINMDTVLGHHGVGIFWNIQDWTIGE